MYFSISLTRHVQLFEPVYPKAKHGNPHYALEKMLRIDFILWCFDLCDPAMEKCLYEIKSMRLFVGLTQTADNLPDVTTIMNFRHLLERNELAMRLPH